MLMKFKKKWEIGRYSYPEVFLYINCQAQYRKYEMRPKWAFQLLPNTPDILGKGFRVDPTSQAIEDEVNALLQRKFNFHGISKLVVRLGEKEGEKDYVESHGVAQKYYPNFNIEEYNGLDEHRKIQAMRKAITDVFNWLISNFKDAQIFEDVQRKLNW